MCAEPPRGIAGRTARAQRTLAKATGGHQSRYPTTIDLLLRLWGDIKRVVAHRTTAVIRYVSARRRVTNEA